MVFIFPFPNFSAVFFQEIMGRQSPAPWSCVSQLTTLQTSQPGCLYCSHLGAGRQQKLSQRKPLTLTKGVHVVCIALQWLSAGASFMDERGLPRLEGCCETDLCEELCEHWVKRCFRDLHYCWTRSVPHKVFQIITLHQTVLPLSWLPLFFPSKPQYCSCRH